jgi:hypothetical protein
MNLHERYHCEKLKSGAAAQEAPAKKQKAKAAAAAKSDGCECKEGGSWAFLNGTYGPHARAIAAGYKKYCTECGEVV